jgi:hypothetical protein
VIQITANQAAFEQIETWRIAEAIKTERAQSRPPL